MSLGRIFIAENLTRLAFVHEALQGYELVSATTLKDAELLVTRSTIDVFVIDIHFDASKAIPLLTTIRRCKQYASTPVVFIRLEPSEYESVLRHTVEAMSNIIQIAEYVEENNGAAVSVSLRKAVDQAMATARSASSA